MTKPSPQQPKLIVEIALILVCKLLIIFALWYFFFSPSHRTTVTAESMGDAFFNSSAPMAEPLKPQPNR